MSTGTLLNVQTKILGSILLKSPFTDLNIWLFPLKAGCSVAQGLAVGPNQKKKIMSNECFSTMVFWQFL